MVSWYGARMLRTIADEVLRQTGAVCFLHMDHCRDESLFEQVLEARFDGFMVDASNHPFARNVEITSIWARRGHDRGLVVEGEIGSIPGAEDDVLPTEQREPTPADQCVEYVARTGVDLVGTDIGTAHGMYLAPPTIRFEWLEAVAPDLRAGIVVHGGTGLDRGTLVRLASAGVAKINFSTELKAVWGNAFANPPGTSAGEVREPLSVLMQARAAVADMALAKLHLFCGARE